MARVHLDLCVREGATASRKRQSALPRELCGSSARDKIEAMMRPCSENTKTLAGSRGSRKFGRPAMVAEHTRSRKKAMDLARRSKNEPGDRELSTTSGNSVGLQEIPIAESPDPSQESSITLRSATIALLPFAFAMILGLRVAEAITISSDLYRSPFCIGCTLSMNPSIIPDLDGSVSTNTAANDLVAPKNYKRIYWEDFGDYLSAEIENEIISSIDPQLGSQRSDLETLIEYRDEYQEDKGCTYLESKLRDPSRVHEECSNVEPSSDYLEFFSMLTLTTVSVISFALLAGAWLLHRLFRNWQLRNIILRDKTTSNLQIRKGR